MVVVSLQSKMEDNGVRKKLRKEMWRDQEGDVVVVETVTSLLEVGLHRQLRPTK
jgi:translation initiation factor IF-1